MGRCVSQGSLGISRLTETLRTMVPMMAAKYIALRCSKTLWMHMRIDHTYAYVAKWGTLERFSGLMCSSRG